MESKYVLEPVVRTVTSLDDPEQRLLIFGETGQTMLGMLIVFALLAGIGVLLVAAFCAAGNHASDRVKDMCGRIFYRVRHVCRKYAWLLLSFIIPFVIMLAAYARIGIFPFGDYTILTNDAIHQYLPFFTELHEKLANGESLFYSFCAGLGYNFWAVIVYYLVSPWNMLVVFVPVNHVVDFMSYLILFKISMSGAVFAWYLSKRKGGNDFSVVIFSCMWALNAFLIGYSYNIMRLDSIMILPYVMYGIERLVLHKSGKMFTLALFYGIVCNYYIGYMLCIFSCLYFLCVCMMKHHRLIDFVKSGFQFMWHGLLAGGMGMVLLIPAYKALQLTTSAGEQAGSWRSLLGSIEIYGSSFDQLIKHFSLTGVVTLSDLQSDVNLYCGVIVLPLVLLFVLDRNIHIRERITKIVLCLFLLLSMNVNVLGFIWHGFHEQYGIPNRFAFFVYNDGVDHGI